MLIYFYLGTLHYIPLLEGLHKQRRGQAFDRSEWTWWVSHWRYSDADSDRFPFLCSYSRADTNFNPSQFNSCQELRGWWQLACCGRTFLPPFIFKIFILPRSLSSQQFSSAILWSSELDSDNEMILRSLYEATFANQYFRGKQELLLGWWNLKNARR